MNRDGIDKADQTVPRVPALRRADPDIVIIHHRCFRGGSVHAPSARRRHAINPTPHRVRLSKLIRQGHMMPAGRDLERRLRVPDVPGVSAPGFRRTGEEKTQMRQPRAAADHPQRPVLIVAGKVRRVGAPFPDDIHRLPGPDLIHLHPGFQRDGIALREIEPALRPRVLDFKTRPLSIQLNRRVVRLKIRKIRRPRPCLITHHMADRNQRHRLLLPKIQLQHRLGIIRMKRGDTECG